jgi:hypothetical protein
VQAKATHDDGDDNDDSLDDVKYKIISSIYSLLHSTRTCLHIKPLLRGTKALCSWRLRYEHARVCESVLLFLQVTQNFVFLRNANINAPVKFSFSASPQSPNNVQK